MEVLFHAVCEATFSVFGLVVAETEEDEEEEEERGVKTSS